MMQVLMWYAEVESLDMNLLEYFRSSLTSSMVLALLYILTHPWALLSSATILEIIDSSLERLLAIHIKVSFMCVMSHVIVIAITDIQQYLKETHFCSMQ
jgi:hypothetical protein